MLTLGIESSCDDTAAAVLQDHHTLLSNISSSQDEIHSRFGGVVPELASRKHLESIHPIVEEALLKAGKNISDIDLIAVTQGPGLIGSLLVGFSYAKAISYVSKTPYIGVDHMTGHLLSVFLEKDKPRFPYVALIASGGTTSIFLCKSFTDFSLLGRTRDDAAGEAFDKIAKLLNLNYPGGPHVSKKAENGNPQAFQFPRAWLQKDSLDFSFSGLKTAVLNKCNQYTQKNQTVPIEDICASFQEAVVEVLVEKTIFAAKLHGIKNIVLGGGVAANNHLRHVMRQACVRDSFKLYTPHPSFCTDNGAMIALSGYYKHVISESPSFDTDVFSRSVLG